MTPRVLLLALGFAACAARYTVATTVALGVTPPVDETAKPITNALLPLAETSIGQQAGLQLVERGRAKQLLDELAKSQALGSRADGPLANGQVAPADLLVSVHLPKPADAQRGRHAVVRVTEGATAVVRGVAAVPISLAEVEDAADEIARYVSWHAGDTRRETPTIAVLPFESVDRFDRVRPLERGLRDMFAATLLARSDYRVVQRSNLDQLLTEIDLVRAGLTEGGRGLEGAPPRQSTFVLSGRIDSRKKTGGVQVIVIAEMRDAATRKVVAIRKETGSPAALPRLVDRLAAELVAETLSARIPAAKEPASAKRTVDELLTAVLPEVRRYIRVSPEDSGHVPFSLAGLSVGRRPGPMLKAGSPLGAHVLRNSIDRLESALFIDPSRLDVALTLGYCRSFHVDGVWQPEQCEQLLRRVIADSDNLRMKRQAYMWLADMYFPHTGGFHRPDQVRAADPRLMETGFEMRLELFRTAPQELRDSYWVRMLTMLERVCETTHDLDQCRRLLDAAILFLETENELETPEKTRRFLASSVASLAYTFARDHGAPEPIRDAGLRLLNRWLTGDAPRLRLHAARNLSYLRKITRDEYAAVIEEVFDSHPDVFRGKSSIAQMTILAGIYRKRGEARRALRLLEDAQLSEDDEGKSWYGKYGFELGQCYEAAGKKRKALETYVRYAETDDYLTYSSDVIQRIRALGGVPLNPDRDIDVRYVDRADGKPLKLSTVRTDGDRLYYAGGRQYNASQRQWERIPHIRSFTPATGEEADLGGPTGPIRGLSVVDGFLWAGTASEGLWRLTLATDEWRQWTQADGLPTDAVGSPVPYGGNIYATVAKLNEKGAITSGSVVRFDPNADKPHVHVYRGPKTPQTAPYWMIIDGDRLLAAEHGRRLTQLDLKSDEWQVLGKRASGVFTGPSGVWLTTGFREVMRLGFSRKENERYRAAWFPSDRGRAGYGVGFMIERDGQLWIGGAGLPWHRFGCSGLYRLDLATNEFTRYGPRDGFRYNERRSSVTHKCYSAVWLDDSLWVATSFGLARVTPRLVPRSEGTTQVR